MKEQNQLGNIELYRSKRKKQMQMHRFIVVLVVLGIGLLLVLGYYGVTKLSISSEEGGGNFPVKLSGDLILQNEMMGSQTVILTDKELLFYNKQGNLLRKISHGDFSPAISCSSDKVLLYDMGGVNFRVESSSGTLLTKSSSNDIIMGKIAENGNIVIVSEDDRYSCRLTVYDKNGDEIFKWYLADNYITAFDFVDSGDGCVVAAVGVSDGFTTTTVYGLDFSKEKEQYQSTITGSLPVAVNVMDNRTQVVCDNQLVLLDKNGSQLHAVPFTQSLKQVVAASDYYTVLLFGEEVKSTSTMVVYDANASVVGSSSSSERIRRIDSDGKHVTALYDDKIICYDMSLEQTRELDHQESVNDVICGGSSGYSVNTTTLNRFALE